MSTIGDIALKLSMDTQPFERSIDTVKKGLRDTETAANKFRSGMNTAANYAAGAFVAMSAVIASSTKAYIDHGDAIDQVTDLTNLSSESASRLIAQMKGFSISEASAGNAAKFFAKNLDDARQGGVETSEAFARLGISAEALQSLGDDELMFRLRDSLSQLDDTTARAAITLQLFGRSGADLADWVNATPGEISKLNEQIERLGLVWGDKELRTWQDAIDAQREMELTMLSMKSTIARDVMPALVPFLQAVAQLLNKLRPLAPVIVPMTLALGAFAAVVKTALVIKQLADGVRLFFDAIKVGKLAQMVTHLGSTSAMLPGLTTSLAANAAQWGAIGIAAGGAAIAIWQAYDAAKQYADAMKQVEAQTAANLTAIDALIAKYKELGRDTSGLQAQRQQIIADSQVDTPWYYYLNPAYTFIEPFAMASGGTVKASPGGTIIRTGESGEDEDIVPASKRQAWAKDILGGGGGGVYVDCTGAYFVGNSRDAAVAITDMVEAELGPRVARAMKGVYA